MITPFFSIIIPTYNRAEFLSRCIDSSINQSFKDWELIIVDDGSTDNTEELVANYSAADERIKYFHQSNQRVSAARNLGLQKAKGQYICFLDSDDEYDTNHLQVFYNELTNSKHTNLFLYTQFRFKDVTSSYDYIPPRPVAYADKRLEKIMNVYLPYSPPVQTICIPATIKDKVVFNSNFALSECYDFNAKVADLCEVKFIPIPTVTLHGHANNVSVPRNIEEGINFNRRQFEEFKSLEKDKFYKEIIKTTAYGNKLLYLQFELTKAYFKQKNLSLFQKSLFKALSYDPSFLIKKVVKKFNKKKQR